MNGLEQTFYIMAIIFMSLVFLTMIAIAVAVFVIKSKINKIHDNIENKLNALTNIAEKGGEVASIATKIVAGRAKKAVKKARK